MSDLLDKIECRIKSYGNCTSEEKGHILKILVMAFGEDNDPYLLPTCSVIMFYYGKYLVGMVSGMENYDLVMNNEHYQSNKSTYHVDYDKKGVFIYNLAVLRSCRRKGLGDALVKVLMNHYKKKGVDYFHTQVDDDNIGSSRIFEKSGFGVQKTLANSKNKNFKLMTFFYKKDLKDQLDI